MIYHRLFYDSDMTIVGIIYFYFFSWLNGERICGQWRRWKELEEEVVFVFAMAMTMAMLTTTAMVMKSATNDYCLLLESNGMIAAIIYFLLRFNENARENLLVTKVMGGGRGIVDWFFVMSMVTAMATATTITSMINHCSFHDSVGTIVAIIYFSFYILWKCDKEFAGGKGNRRGEGNLGLVDYYEDGDSDCNGNDNCLI